MSVELTLHRDNLPAAAAMPRTPCDDNALSFYRRGDPNVCGRLRGSGKRGYPLRNAASCVLLLVADAAIHGSPAHRQSGARICSPSKFSLRDAPTSRTAIGGARQVIVTPSPSYHTHY